MVMYAMYKVGEKVNEPKFKNGNNNQKGTGGRTAG